MYLSSDDWLFWHKLHMYTDVSGSNGYAAVYGSKWFAEYWLGIHADILHFYLGTFPNCPDNWNLGHTSL